ncbi:MAG: dienelactone hydrolase family protein [Alphaproteobacteria bacterium]|nr:dienelactone hydrolase family protein [Alphaproteobacteria bacterium]
MKAETDIMLRGLIWGFLLLLACTLPARAESFEFTSRTYAGFYQLLRGEASGEVTIKAALALPASSGPHPVLVVAHSCDGWSGAGHGEALILEAARSAGYATLVYDSFVPRAWSNVCSGGAGAAGSPSLISDAFAALEALAKDDRIRKDAIFIAGASMGGMTSWFTALEPLRRRLVSGDLRFAGHSSFYPSGEHGFMADKVFAGGPVLVMFGLDDDWTPPRRARLMVERQMSYSKVPPPDIRLIDYENARHGWLNVQMQGVKQLPSASSRLNCPLIFMGQSLAANHLIWVDGREMDVAPSDMKSHLATCAMPGVTIEGSREATNKSLSEMIGLMNRIAGK